MSKQIVMAARLACASGLALGALALAAGAAEAQCSNEAVREAQGPPTTSLPDCMALEMVSPPRKFTQPAFLPAFSREGGRVVLMVRIALADTPGYQYYEGDPYVASRGAGGWELAPTSPLEPAITGGGRRWGNATVFTSALDRWALLGSTQAQYAVGVSRLFGGGLDGSYAPLSPPLVPIDGSGSADLATSVLNLELSGASADLTTTVLRVDLPSTGYLPGDPRSSSASSVSGASSNSYLAFLDEGGEPALELLARDNDGKVIGGLCGAHLGGLGAPGNRPTFNQGVISPDGSRVYFSTRLAQPWDPEEDEEPSCDSKNGVRVMKRVATPAGPVITQVAPGGGGATAPGDDLFQAASADGTKVYFLSPRKLTAADTDTATGPCDGNLGASEGCDLYLYDETKPPAERVALASDADGAVEADVLRSTTAISGDASRAYFVAQGVLTSDPNPEGEAAQAGAPNLYLYEAAAKELSFLGTLSAKDQGGGEDFGGLWAIRGSGFGDAYAAPLYGPGLEGGGDGHVLAFASKASLTADDEDGGFRDVFHYDAEAETLERLSKAAVGGEDNGPFDAYVNPAILKVIGYNFGEATRWMSEDGQTVAFATAEPLIPGDEDGELNPYVWNTGELGASFAKLLEAGGVAVKAPGAAPLGHQVVFSTPTALLPRDKDVAEDVYVARAEGGFSEPAPVIPCHPLLEGDCQGPPSPKPAAVPPPAAGGNVKAPRRKCEKRQVKRKGKCVRKKLGKGKAGKRRGGRS